jgi:hypothetical protein
LALYKTRFIDTLAIVAKEGQHLSYSWHRLFAQTIDLNWVGNLAHTPELAEQLEATRIFTTEIRNRLRTKKPWFLFGWYSYSQSSEIMIVNAVGDDV